MSVYFDRTAVIVKLPNLARQDCRRLIDSGTPRHFRGLVTRIGRAIEQWNNDLLLSIPILDVSFADNSLDWRDGWPQQAPS